MSPTRRRTLALGTALLSTGCLGTGQWSSETESRSSDTATASSQSTTTRERTERTAQHTTDRCEAGVDVWARAFDPASDLPLTLGTTERTLVTEAVSNGHVDYTTYARPPLESGVFVTHEGAFYRTQSTLKRVEEVPAFSMDVEWERGQTAPTDATVVSLASLPQVDRDVLRTAVLHPEHEGLPREGLSIREYAAPYPDSEPSRLIGTQTWVHWRDRTFRVRVAGESEATQERRTVRYTVEQVAETADAFRRLVAERYLVTLDDRPREQRELVEDALVRGYEECRPPSTALTRLRDRLSGFERLPDPHENSWYAALDGRRFRIEIVEWMH